MPRRSTGCEKCRQRKVRCDEQRPHCQRCADYGVICPGYRPSADKDLHFVDQTQHIARKAGSQVVTHQVHHVARQDTQYRFKNQFSGQLLASEPVAISGRHVHRTQLLSTFLSLYLPRKRHATMMSHFAYMTALPTIDLSTPLLQIAVDTLCLAELGSLYDDERCLQESRGRYVRALPTRAKELARPPKQQLPKDTILASITILALCELFGAIAKANQAGNGWISHVQGAQQFIRANREEVMKSSFGRLLFHNCRHGSLCMGLVKRQAVFFGEREWLEVTKGGDSYVALCDLALQAPGLLERADRIGDSGEDLRRLCGDITTLRQELQEWSERPDMVDSYDIVDIRDMKEFSKLVSDRTLVTVFDFPYVQMCSEWPLFWIISLMMDSTILNLYRIHGKLPDLARFTPRSKEDIWREMFVHATSYCRSIPCCMEPETASAGRIGTFLLRVTQSFLEVAGYEREIEWCRAVRKVLEESGAVRRSRKAEAKEPKPSYSVTCGGPLPPVVLEGGYPGRGYNPRRHDADDEESEYVRPPAAEGKQERVWPPAFFAMQEADLMKATAGTTAACRDVEIERPGLGKRGTWSGDWLVDPPKVVGLSSVRVGLDPGEEVKYARRWNVPPGIAERRARLLMDGERTTT